MTININEQGSMMVISLDARRKPAWDKPLTTEFEKDRSKQQAPSNEDLASSHEKRGRVLGFRHKVFRS